MQVHLEELTSSSLSDEAERQLRKEILRLRDLVVGKDAELATALGRAEELEATIMRYDNLEQQLNAMRGSTSWRLTQALGLPLRKFRTRGTRGE
jgi:hypothetical protein